METLIGRERELADIRARLEQGERLITLVGPPGVGKTRLLRELSPNVIEVAYARTESELVSAIAHAEGIPLAADDHIERIATALGDRTVHIDNLEQVLDGARTVIAALLRKSDACFVVTSRERLALDDEVVVHVAPLARADAIALFQTRALHVDQSMGELVDRLDRLPLAIELAAARTRVLKPAALLARLSTSGFRAEMSSAVEWSWELLPEDERRALAELSVFVTAVPIDLAEATLSARDPLAPIERLVEQSLVHSDGERLSVYESVREVARPRDPDPERTLAARAAVVIALAEKQETVGPREREALDTLATLAPELEASVRDRVAHDAALAARGLLALEPLIHHRGPLDRYIELCTSVLSRHEDAALYRARGEARRLAGDVRGAESDLARAGDDPRALRILLHLRGCSEAELAALLPRVRDPRTHAEILGRMGDMRLAASDLAGARDHHARALSVALSASSASLEAIARCNLGAVAYSERRFGDAREHLERALMLWRELKNRRLEGVALEHLVAMHHDEGDIDAAISASREARALHRAVGDRLFEGPSLFAAGCLELSRDRVDDAEALFQAAIDACIATKNERFEQFARAWYATAAFARGRFDHARSLLSAVRVPPGDRHLEVFVDCWRAALDRRAPSASGALSDLVEIVTQYAEGSIRAEPRSAEGRIARRLLQGSSTLVVAADGRYFERDGGRVDLTRRASMRRILAALVASRGAALSIEAIVEAGWPGERLRSDAALARVYTAVRTLRKLGLGDVLRTSGDGYLLDPDVDLRVDG